MWRYGGEWCSDMRLSQRYDIKRYGDMHAKSYSDLLQANEWKPSIAQSSEVLILQYPSGSRSCVANSWAEARLLWSFLCRHLVCPEELSEVTVLSAQTQFCTACQKPTRQLSSSRHPRTTTRPGFVTTPTFTYSLTATVI